MVQMPLSEVYHPIMEAHRHKAQFKKARWGNVSQSWYPPKEGVRKECQVQHLLINKHLSLTMQYCRCKLNLSVNSCLLFSAPRWNEATLLITEEKPVWGKRKIGTQHSLLSYPLDPNSIISASFTSGTM